MTFGRRIELMRQVRDLAARLEYFEAGRDAKNEYGGQSSGRRDRPALHSVGRGGDSRADTRRRPCHCRRLMDSGPEELFFEALTAVKAECGLDENERKN